MRTWPVKVLLKLRYFGFASVKRKSARASTGAGAPAARCAVGHSDPRAGKSAKAVRTRFPPPARYGIFPGEDNVRSPEVSGVS
jgi:hypothetical protein